MSLRRVHYSPVHHCTLVLPVWAAANLISKTIGSLRWEFWCCCVTLTRLAPAAGTQGNLPAVAPAALLQLLVAPAEDV